MLPDPDDDDDEVGSEDMLPDPDDDDIGSGDERRSKEKNLSKLERTVFYPVPGSNVPASQSEESKSVVPLNNQTDPDS